MPPVRRGIAAVNWPLLNATSRGELTLAVITSGSTAPPVPLITRSDVPSSFAASTTKSTWAQIVATTSKDYLKQDVYNSTTWNSTLPPAAGSGFMPIVKPPPRCGHTMDTVTKRFLGRTIQHEVYLFGGKLNGVRKHLWRYRPGIYNTSQINGGTTSGGVAESGEQTIKDVPDIFDASESGDLTNVDRLCAKAKQSSAYAHVCNTWQPVNASILRNDCASQTLQTNDRQMAESSRMQYLLVTRGRYCAGMSSAIVPNVSPAIMTPLVLQKCSSNFTQRFSLMTDASAGQDGTVRVLAQLDQYGKRVNGACLTADSDGKTVSMTRCVSENAKTEIITSISESSGIPTTKTTTTPFRAAPETHILSLENVPGFPTQKRLRFNATGRCLAIEMKITSSGALPNLPVVDDGLIGSSLVQRPCDDSSSTGSSSQPFQPVYFTGFELSEASNSCDRVSYVYDIASQTGSGTRYKGRHLGRYGHSKVVLAPLDPRFDLLQNDQNQTLLDRVDLNDFTSSEYGKLFVMGGRDEEVGYLADVWSFSIRTQQWEQLFDGGSWRNARDAHLHSNEKIRPTLEMLSSMFGGVDQPAVRTFPAARAAHSAIPMFQSQKTSTVKHVDVIETQSVTDASSYQSRRFKVGNGFALVFPDNDKSPFRVARTRDFGMFRQAKKEGWNGTFYPFSFRLNNEAYAESIVFDYTVELLS